VGAGRPERRGRTSRRTGVPCTAPGDGTAPRASHIFRGGVLTSAIVASRRDEEDAVGLCSRDPVLRRQICVFLRTLRAGIWRVDGSANRALKCHPVSAALSRHSTR
jgi:hypothetical protein